MTEEIKQEYLSIKQASVLLGKKYGYTRRLLKRLFELKLIRPIILNGFSPLYSISELRAALEKIAQKAKTNEEKAEILLSGGSLAERRIKY